MLLWKLAFRNLLRNRGRLVLNLALLVGSFSVIIVFKGFESYVLKTIRELVIDNQYGHIQIARESYWKNTPVDVETDRMIDASSEWIPKISAMENVSSVSGRVSFFGLIDYAGKSITARFMGIQQDKEPQVQNSLSIQKGDEFKNSKQNIMSLGIETKLKVPVGQEVTFVSPTLSGGINAMDSLVTGIFSSGFSEIDKATVIIPLNDALKLRDSDMIDAIVVRLKHESNIESLASEISNQLKGTDLQVKTWKDLAQLYNQVEDFYLFQNLFVEVIIILLLFLSVTSTVTMVVYERISEIGTLRAMGDYESDIRKLLAIESLLLAVFAVLIGMPVSLLVIEIISALDISITLPLASQPLQFLVVPSFNAYIEASVVCLVSVVLASLGPAKKGAQVPIPSALSAKL